jgi:hypothetical protein
LIIIKTPKSTKIENKVGMNDNYSINVNNTPKMSMAKESGVLNHVLITAKESTVAGGLEFINT